MAVSLSKGGNISLDKAAPGIKNVLIGLGWDERATDGTEFDLDASVFMLKADGKVRGDNEHTGDNRTGAGTGDDESVKVDLSLVPSDIDKIVMTVTIHNAEANNLNFGQVSNAFIRVVNEADNQEVCRYDLSEDYSIETAMVFGELYRHGGEWKFRAVGQGYQGGLNAMAMTYGVNV